MDSLALTDHGVMYGVIEFYRLAKDAGIRPIIGCEVYVAQKMEIRGRNLPFDKSNYHLVLLVRNQTGYRNLIQIVTTCSSGRILLQAAYRQKISL